MRALVGLAAITLVAGCGLLPPTPPDWVTNRSAMPSCGEETLDRGLPEDSEAWTCLMDAAEQGEEAELIRHLTTMEGDSMTQILRVHANGQIELIIDATRDQWGSGRWERLECDRLLPGGGWDGCIEVPAP